MSGDGNIRLHGLSPRQAELCDMLWACQTVSEVKFLLDYCLTDEDRAMAVTLLEIMHMEAAEQDGDLEIVKPIVDDFLQRIMESSK